MNVLAALLRVAVNAKTLLRLLSMVVHLSDWEKDTQEKKQVFRNMLRLTMQI